MLWLGQNQAEKAVDDLFDGMSLDSNGGGDSTTPSTFKLTSTIKNPIQRESMTNSTTQSLATATAITTNNNNLSVTNANHFASSHHNGGLKKLQCMIPIAAVPTTTTTLVPRNGGSIAITTTDTRSTKVIQNLDIFVDEIAESDVDGSIIAIDQSEDTSNGVSSKSVNSICPTPVKIIKKEDDDDPLSPLSSIQRSHLAVRTVVSPNPIITQANPTRVAINANPINTSPLSSSTTTTTATTLSIAVPQSQQHNNSSLHPVARKRTAYQALVGSTSNHSTTPTNSNSIGLIINSPNCQSTNSLSTIQSESSPEVSSSQNCTGISPAPSLESSEIDLELWDLDIHESSASNSSGWP